MNYIKHLLSVALLFGGFNVFCAQEMNPSQEELEQMQQMQVQFMMFVQEVSLRITVEIIRNEMSTIVALVRSKLKDQEKSFALISKLVAKYIAKEIPSLLTAVAEQLGLTNQSDISNFVQEYGAMIKNATETRLQEFITIVIATDFIRNAQPNKIQMKKN